jgi:integrase
MIATIDRSTARGSRDAALILLGFASALRRSELAGLELADIDPKPEGLLICVRKSKADPEAGGQLVGVAHGNHPATDPVAALNDWLTHRGTQPGQLFRGFIRNRIATRPFTGSGLARVLKIRAAAAGIPSERVSGHSLRAGHATTSALAGVGLDRIAAQTRHTRISTLVEHYIRPSKPCRSPPAATSGGLRALRVEHDGIRGDHAHHRHGRGRRPQLHGPGSPRVGTQASLVIVVRQRALGSARLVRHPQGS